MISVPVLSYKEKPGEKWEYGVPPFFAHHVLTLDKRKTAYFVFSFGIYTKLNDQIVGFPDKNRSRYFNEFIYESNPI